MKYAWLVAARRRNLQGDENILSNGGLIKEAMVVDCGIQCKKKTATI